MKKTCIISVLLMMMLLVSGGCSGRSEIGTLLDDMIIVKQQALYLFDMTGGSRNILYFKGYMISEKDTDMLQGYFSGEDITVGIGAEGGGPVMIGDAIWEFRKESGRAAFDLSLVCCGQELLPGNIIYLYISDDSGEKRYDIGQYQIYMHELSSAETIFPAYSPFAFASAPEYGTEFKVSYQFLLDAGDIAFSVMLPDDCDFIDITDVSYAYSEELTEEYMRESGNKDENRVIYAVDVTYRQLKEGNMHFQPLVAAGKEGGTVYCRPFVPFFITYDDGRGG